MATLGRGSPSDPKTAGQSPVARGSFWQLHSPLDAYAQRVGSGLATQVAPGRQLQVLEPAQSDGRLPVRLHGDGYPCWLEARQLLQGGEPIAQLPPLPRMQRATIAALIPRVLAFAEAAMARPNTYLWGGTLGPDFDCSGLIQAAYGAEGVWLPRDAYLQERFCRPVAVQPGVTHRLEPGDLLFFGPARRCTHVALHLGEGYYLHSSGREHGRHGIGIDNLHPRNPDPVASYYRGQLRGAGRVMHSHDGSPCPD